MALNVCMLSSEVAPLSKTGGLADVSGALTKYLHAAGHDVRLFTPLYSSIDRSKLNLRAVEFLEDVGLELGPHRYRYSVLVGQLPGSAASVYLIDCPVLFGRKVGLAIEFEPATAATERHPAKQGKEKRDDPLAARAPDVGGTAFGTEQALRVWL